MSERLEVTWQGEAPFLFEVLWRFSNQVYGQTDHGGSSQQTAEGKPFSFSQAFSTAVTRAVCLEERETRGLKRTMTGKQMFI